LGTFTEQGEGGIQSPSSLREIVGVRDDNFAGVRCGFDFLPRKGSRKKPRREGPIYLQGRRGEQKMGSPTISTARKSNLHHVYVMQA